MPRGGLMPLRSVDPPNRAAFTEGEPRQLTYAQADSMVSAIAQRLRDIGLPADAIVAAQFANTCESVLVAARHHARRT